MKNKIPLILAVDFDNTTAVTTRFPEIDRLKKGAKKYINRLYDQGYYIIINTCRTDNIDKQILHASRARHFLIQNGVKFHEFNENHSEICRTFKANSRKISADMYIDDKGLWLFGLPHWFFLYWIIKIKSKFIKNPLHKYIKYDF